MLLTVPCGRPASPIGSRRCTSAPPVFSQLPRCACSPPVRRQPDGPTAFYARHVHEEATAGLSSTAGGRPSIQYSCLCSRIVREILTKSSSPCQISHGTRRSTPSSDPTVSQYSHHRRTGIESWCQPTRKNQATYCTRHLGVVPKFILETETLEL
jgi:hypothetical protein